MIKLSDYIGVLFKSLGDARVTSDFESLRIAKSYADDSLLKHFPIPRFRLDEVELIVPVAIQGFNTSPSEESSKLFNEIVFESLKTSAGVTSISKNIEVELKKIISDNTNNLFKVISSERDSLQLISKYLLNIYGSTNDLILKEKVTNQDYKEIFIKSGTEKLSILTKDIINKNPIDNPYVIVDAAKLKEYLPSNLVQIKVKMREEALEWHRMIDEDGNDLSKLLPE